MSTISQRSFSGGELSPKLRSRVDFFKYQTGAAKIRNFIPLKQGGVTNRPGTVYAHRAKDYDKKVRLIPFDAGSSGRFILEFGMQYIRFFKDGSIILDGDIPYTISNITTAGPVVTVSHNADGDGIIGSRVIISGLSGDIGKTLNGVEFEAYDFGVGSFKIRNTDGTPIDFGYSSTYVSGGQFQSPYEKATNWNEDDLFTIKYAQSVDILALSHRFVETAFLKRNADNDWDLDPSFGDNVGECTITTVANIGTAGTSEYYYAAVPVYNGIIAPIVIESTPPSGYLGTVTGNATLNTSNFNRITVAVTGNWDNVYIYKLASSGIYGFIGIATVAPGDTAVFDDIGFTPDTTGAKFPDKKYVLKKAGALGFVQQRLWYGDVSFNEKNPKYGITFQVSERETVMGSVLGQYGSFFRQQSITDDGSIKFKADSRKFNPPRHILDLSRMIIMTENCELVVNPDGSPITPLNLTVKAQSYNGCSEIPPIVINENALYIQARGNVVRDLNYNYTIDGFSGNDISIFADHLFEGYQLIDWGYQAIPNSNVWVVRDDGKLLCLTYLKEQEVLGWSVHDLEDAKVKSVACVSAENEDVTYIVVERTINNKKVQYIEYFNSRYFDKEKQKQVITDESADPEIRNYSGLEEAVFVDSAVSFDGRNFDTAKKMRVISGAPSFTPDDIITLQSNFSFFKSTDVGNEIHLKTRDGSLIRLEIVEYTSATSVEVTPKTTVPTELIGTYTSDWAYAVDEFFGLHHLEGKSLSIFGNAFVDANPNNESYDVVTVNFGKVELPNPRSYVVFGLPYTSDLKTLRIDTAQSETMMDKRINISKLTMNLLDTRGLWVGIDDVEDGSVEGLIEMKPRNNEGYTSPAELKNEPDSVIIDSGWTKEGQVFIRQIDPVPATILSIHPSGHIPFKG